MKPRSRLEHVAFLVWLASYIIGIFSVIYGFIWPRQLTIHIALIMAQLIMLTPYMIYLLRRLYWPHKELKRLRAELAEKWLILTGLPPEGEKSER